MEHSDGVGLRYFGEDLELEVTMRGMIDAAMHDLQHRNVLRRCQTLKDQEEGRDDHH